MASGAEVDVVLSEEQPRINSPSKPDGSTTRKRRNFFKKKDSSEEQSRRPLDNKWLQQQIPACRPVFTALHAFVGFLIIGVAFLVIGAILTAFTARLREFEVSYDGCAPIMEDMLDGDFETCEQYLDSISNVSNLNRLDYNDCHCQINFTLPEDLRPSWNFYYGMRNYYQNHRRYLNSWDVNQLRGSNFRSPTADCRPFVRIDVIENGTEVNRPVVPCGLIANSWFNDSFDSFISTDDMTVVELDRTNIAWDTDRSVRFRNPDGTVNTTEADLEGTTRPPNWPRSLADVPQGLQNESLMVWFRVSAFPWFRKLYARPIVDGNRDAELPKGNYSIVLTYNYPVRNFDGKKSIILAETNWLGGRNLFLGVAYLVVGVLCIITSFFLLGLHKLCSNWKLNKAPFNNNY